MSTQKLLKTHTFVFNPKDNGGEQLTLTTKFVSNGDKGVALYDQELSLNSYCNVASFHILGAPITPSILRKLANELESLEIQARAMTNETVD